MQVLVLAFLTSAGIVKKLWKTTRNIKKKLNKIGMLARSKLNSIERNYEELKERIRMPKSQISDTEKGNLVDEVKKV